MTRARDVADTQDNVGGSVPPSVAGKNAVINGGFDIWQRGTSFTDPTSTTTAMSADRWFSYRSGWATGITTTRQTASLEGFQYSIRQARNSGNTSTAQLFLGQNFETVNSIPYANKTVTLSFWAKAGANFSSGSSLLTVQLYTGTGTDQNVISGLTGAATPINTTQAITTSWVRYSFTGTVGSTATQLVPYLSWTPVGTAGANDWVEITGVQLELGNVATPFSRAGGNIQGELAACQRYYYRSSQEVSGNYAMGICYSTTTAFIDFQVPVTMRVVPTALDYSNVQLWDATNTQAVTSLTIQSNNNSSNVVCLFAAVASGLTQYRPYILRGNGSANYIGVSAEL